MTSLDGSGGGCDHYPQPVGTRPHEPHWLLAIDIIKVLKQQGWQPLLLARGGVEAHGAEVLQEAEAAGLSVVERTMPQKGVEGLLQTMQTFDHSDVVHLRSPLELPVIACSSAARRQCWPTAVTSRLDW